MKIKYINVKNIDFLQAFTACFLASQVAINAVEVAEVQLAVPMVAVELGLHLV